MFGNMKWKRERKGNRIVFRNARVSSRDIKVIWADMTIMKTGEI